MKKTTNHIIRIISPLIAALAIFLIPGLRFTTPVWQLNQSIILLAILMAVAFLVGHLILLTPLMRTGNIILHLFRVIAVTTLVTSPVFLYFLMKDIDVSRMVIVYEVVLLFVLLLINSFSKLTVPGLVINSIAAIIVIIISLPGLSSGSGNSQIAGSDNTVRFELANYHDIKITSHKILDKREYSEGGSIEAIDDTRLLLASGYGKFFLIDTKEGNFVSKKLNFSAPINADTYQAEVANPNVHFRVTDILLEKNDSDMRKLYVAHHYYHSDKQCYTLRISETELDLNTFTAGDWVTGYDSVPCFKIKVFANLTGGRLGFNFDGSLLLTVGAHSYRTRQFVDLEGSHYGRVMQIDPTDWSVRVFTTGHRNPQGLYVSEDTIWSTEHGPEGGDELNILEEGADYGWPTSSFGTDYGKKTYEGHSPGDHSYGHLPFYAWIPSIGTSNLIELKGEEFPAWKGDLFVSSLNASSIYRIRIRDKQIITIERLFIGERIRDITELHTGKVALWNGVDTLLILESANSIFSKCIGCHELTTVGDGIGPSLSKIVGRKVASVDGFPYSAGMKNYGGRWTPERLDTFLADPAKAVPGTNMQFEGIADPEQRRELIQLLQQETDIKWGMRR